MSLDVGDVDAWIDTLSQCKQLSESDVKLLCDKVGVLPTHTAISKQIHRPEKSLSKSLTYSPLDAQSLSVVISTANSCVYRFRSRLVPLIDV